jgi:hypothetical protein
MKEDNTTIDPTWMAKTGGFAKDMTMRDWYAGLAMQGILADPTTPRSVEIEGAAYYIADAMLKAREK